MNPHQEIEEELRSHIELRAADLERRGLSPAQALREARLEFGSLARFTEEGREAKGWRTRDLLASTFAASSRFLRRNPLYALASILPVTLGIAAASLIFSAAFIILQRPLPIPDAARVFNARLIAPEFAALHPDVPITSAHYLTWRTQCKSCESIAIVDGGVYSQPFDPRRLNALEVSPEFFSILGLPVPAGFGATRQAVLAAHVPPAAVLQLDGQTVPVAATLPATALLPRAEQLGEMMHFPPQIDILLPVQFDPSDPGFHYSALVKLRPGVSVAQAEAELTVGASRTRLTPLQQQLTAEARQPLLLFTAGAALLLLITALNFGNLHLTRIGARRPDLAIHTALGASPADLLRHTLAEIAALLLASALTAGLLATLAMRALVHSAPAFLPRLSELTVLPSAWALSVLLTGIIGATCVAFALRLEPRGARGLQNALTFSAAALTVVLVSTAGLLLLSYARLRGADHGFATSHLATFHIDAPDPAKHQPFLHQLRQLPGVIAAGSSNRLPLQGECFFNPVIQPSVPTPGPIAAWRVVSPGYFAAAGTPLLAGREFTDADRGQSLAIISLRVAYEIFPGQDPIGQQIYEEIGAEKHTARIIGVAADVKARHINAAAPPIVYAPIWQAPFPYNYYVVRTTGDSRELLDSARQLAAESGLAMAPERVTSMEAMVDHATQPQRWQSYWTAGFAALGLLTACLGLFGSVRFQLSRRTAEIALRIALGATRRTAARMLLGESMRPVWFGVIAGLAVVLRLGQLIEPQLYAVHPYDPWVLTSAAAAVLLAALTAAYISIRRAVRIDPMTALRPD